MDPRRAVILDLHVAPPERRGLRSAEKSVPENGQQGDVHLAPTSGSPSVLRPDGPASVPLDCMAVAFTAARAVSVNGFAWRWGRPFARAMPAMTFLTPSLSVGSW